MDASPHLMAPTQEEEFKGDKRLASPQTRNSGYTTNAIESLNSKLRSSVRSRGHFPSDEAATKLLYLVLRDVAKNWTMPQREWTAAKTQFAILFGDRFSLP